MKSVNHFIPYGKSVITQHYVDYAATHSELTFMLGCASPDKWVKYLQKNYPDVKFKIVEGGILINPKKGRGDA